MDPFREVVADGGELVAGTAKRYVSVGTHEILCTVGRAERLRDDAIGVVQGTRRRRARQEDDSRQPMACDERVDAAAVPAFDVTTEEQNETRSDGGALQRQHGTVAIGAADTRAIRD